MIKTKIEHKYRLIFLVAIAVIFTELCIVSLQDGAVWAASTSKPAKPIKGPHVLNELLVKFNIGVDSNQAKADLLKYGFTSIKRYKQVSNLYHVRIPSVLTADAAIDLLQSDPDVEYAEPNYLMEGDSACSSSPCTPNDTLYSDPGNWGFANIGAPQAWAVTTGDSSLVVAVIDSGIDYNHPDLANNKWTNQAEASGTPAFYGYNAVADIGSGGLCPPPASSFPIDDDTSVLGHGTRLAGIIGAVGNNSTGIAGVNWNVKLMPIKVRCEPDRQSNLALFIAGMDYMLTEKQAGVNIRVANMSVGVSTYSQSLQNILDAARDAGILLVASAGNSSTNLDLDSTDFHSNEYDNVLFVAATDQTNALAGFSNYGQVDIHLAAPGVGILSTVRSVYNPMYQPDDGTSYSTPMVTGVAALLASSDPSLTVSELKARIMSSTVQTNALMSKVAAGGRLNAAGIFNAPIADLLPMGYQLARLQVGDKYHLDRPFVVASIPQGLNGLWWVRTKNNDKTNTSPNYIQIGLNQAATVYVAYDSRVTADELPDWLRSDQGWLDTGLFIGTSNNGTPSSLHLYSKTFIPGTAVLGGPQAVGYNGPVGSSGTNYVVLINLLSITAPTNLNATDLPSDNGGAIQLTWTPSATPGIVAQRVYRATTSGGPYTLISSFADNTTNAYIDSGLTNGTTYYYVVRSSDGTQESANSNESSAAPVDNLAPAAPTALAAVDNPGDNGGAIRLTWNPSVSSDVMSQGIYRSTTPGGPYTIITSIANNTTKTYTDSGLTNGMTYYYIARSYDGTQSSANSNEASAAPVDNLAPAPPTSLSAVDNPADNGGAIRLTWTPSVSPDVTAQRVYRATTAGGPYTIITSFANNTTNTYTDSGLTNGKTYYYIVQSFDGTQSSANSNESSAVPVVNIALAAPTALVAADNPGDNGGAIRLSWGPSGSRTAVAQRFYRATTSGGPYFLVMSFADNTTNSYTDIGLTNGTRYYYVVRAFDGSQESANSNESSAAPVDNLAPAAPTALVAVDNPGDNGGATLLTWNPSVSSDVVSQGIYRSTAPGGPYTIITSLANNTTKTYTDSGLTNGMTYYYIARSYDGTQSSANSNESSAVPVINIALVAPVGYQLARLQVGDTISSGQNLYRCVHPAGPEWSLVGAHKERRQDKYIAELYPDWTQSSGDSIRCVRFARNGRRASGLVAAGPGLVGHGAVYWNFQ